MRLPWLAGEVKIEFQEKTIELLTQEIDERKIPQLYVIELLGETRSDKAVEALIPALKDSEGYVRSDAAEALGRIVEIDHNLPTLTPQLPHLLTLIPTEASQQALSVIVAIQARCEYYNYEIW